MHSVRRVSERVNKSRHIMLSLPCIAYAIPNLDSKPHVEALFKVLCGGEPLSSAVQILDESALLKDYSLEHKPSDWRASKNWWMRPNHLSELNEHTYNYNLT